MNTQPLVVKRSELINQLVLDRTTTEEVGHIEELWLDQKLHQILGFNCKSGLLGVTKRPFTWSEIETIGSDSLIVNFRREEKTAQKPAQVAPLIEHEVWTDTGNKVGKIIDYLINIQTGKVINYLFVSSGWRGVLDGVYLLSPAAITSIGSKRVIVADAVVQEPQFYTEGLQQKVVQAVEGIKDDYVKKIDLEGIKRGAQNLGEQVKEGAQNLGEQVKDKAKEVTEQVKEGAQNLGEQVKDKAKEVTEGAQNLGEQVKDKAKEVTEGAQNLGEQVKDKAKEVTGKAKEGAQNLGEQVKDKAKEVQENAQNLGEKIKDKAKEVTEKAKEKLLEIKSHPPKLIPALARETPDVTETNTAKISPINSHPTESTSPSEI